MFSNFKNSQIYSIFSNTFSIFLVVKNKNKRTNNFLSCPFFGGLCLNGPALHDCSFVFFLNVSSVLVVYFDCDFMY